LFTFIYINMNSTNKPQVEVLELSESSKVAQLKHAETIRKVEAQKRARLVQGNRYFSI